MCHQSSVSVGGGREGRREGGREGRREGGREGGRGGREGGREGGEGGREGGREGGGGREGKDYSSRNTYTVLIIRSLLTKTYLDKRERT